MDKQREWFLEVQLTPGENAVNIVQMTLKDLEYYIKVVNKVMEELTSVLKVRSKSITCYREIFVKGRACQCSKMYSIILRNCSDHFSLQQPPP